MINRTKCHSIDSFGESITFILLWYVQKHMNKPTDVTLTQFVRVKPVARRSAPNKNTSSCEVCLSILTWTGLCWSACASVRRRPGWRRTLEWAVWTLWRFSPGRGSG